MVPTDTSQVTSTNVANRTELGVKDQLIQAPTSPQIQANVQPQTPVLPVPLPVSLPAISPNNLFGALSNMDSATLEALTSGMTSTAGLAAEQAVDRRINTGETAPKTPTTATAPKGSVPNTPPAAISTEDLQILLNFVSPDPANAVWDDPTPAPAFDGIGNPHTIQTTIVQGAQIAKPEDSIATKTLLSLVHTGIEAVAVGATQVAPALPEGEAKVSYENYLSLVAKALSKFAEAMQQQISTSEQNRAWGNAQLEADRHQRETQEKKQHEIKRKQDKAAKKAHKKQKISKIFEKVTGSLGIVMSAAMIVVGVAMIGTVGAAPLGAMIIAFAIGSALDSTVSLAGGPSIFGLVGQEAMKASDAIVKSMPLSAEGKEKLSMVMQVAFYVVAAIAIVAVATLAGPLGLVVLAMAIAPFMQFIQASGIVERSLVTLYGVSKERAGWASFAVFITIQMAAMFVSLGAGIVMMVAMPAAMPAAFSSVITNVLNTTIRSLQRAAETASEIMQVVIKILIKLIQIMLRTLQIIQKMANVADDLESLVNQMLNLVQGIMQVGQGTSEVGRAVLEGTAEMDNYNVQAQIARIQASLDAEVELTQTLIKLIKKLMQELLDGSREMAEFAASVNKSIAKLFDQASNMASAAVSAA